MSWWPCAAATYARVPRSRMYATCKMQCNITYSNATSTRPEPALVPEASRHPVPASRHSALFVQRTLTSADYCQMCHVHSVFHSLERSSFSPPWSYKHKPPKTALIRFILGTSRPLARRTTLGAFGGVPYSTHPRTSRFGSFDTALPVTSTPVVLPGWNGVNTVKYQTVRARCCVTRQSSFVRRSEQSRDRFGTTSRHKIPSGSTTLDPFTTSKSKV